MDSINDMVRQIRASEQRFEMSYRMMEAINSASQVARTVASARNRLRNSDIPSDGREMFAADARDARATLLRAAAYLEEIEGMCAAPAAAPAYLEAAE